MTRLFSKFTVVVFLFGLLLPFQGDGATITYQYDRINRLTSVTFGDGTQITYTYDPAGNRVSRTISKAVVTLKGDINGDEAVNLADAIQGLQVSAGLEPDGIRTNYGSSGTDVNLNQKIGMEEVVYILQKTALLR